MSTRSMAKALLVLLVVSATYAQQPPAAAPPGAAQGRGGAGPGPRMTPEQTLAVEQAAMAKLSGFDGIWRGSGWMKFGPDRHEYPSQVVRVGSLDDGMIKVFEILGYTADGKLDNHQLNMVTFDPQKQQYVMLARGGPFSNTFGFRVTDDGYVWALSAGPGPGGIQFKGALKNGVWTQLTEAVSPDKPSAPMGEWTLHRVATTDWPEGKLPKAH